MWRSCMLVLLGGCSSLLGIHDFEQTAFDASVGSDGAADATVAHDEDDDGLDDTIDHCPHLPSTGGSNPDTDGDGVGDPCDPNPGTPGDHIAEFITFATSTGGFSFTGPAPALQDDQLVVDTTSSQLVATEPGTLGKDILEMGVTLGTAAAGQRQVAIVAASTTNLNAIYYCQLYGPNASSASFGFTYTTDGSAYTNNTVTASAPLASSATRIAMDHHAGTLDCRTTWPATTQTVAGNTVPFTTGAYGFAIQGLHLQIDWVIHIHTD